MNGRIALWASLGIALLLVAQPALAASRGRHLPVMVGHRGCGVGVENTVVAYEQGVDSFHYAGLECDVRVTLDSQLVIWHDPTVVVSGDTLSIADTPLERLREGLISQKRSDSTYVGQLCTVEEYLRICVDRQVFPIIELKWSRGICNDDMSCFPRLDALIRKYGLQDRALILTSMRKSLDYVRREYPDLQCQYLMYSFTQERFDWCVENRVQPSVRWDGLTREWVQKCHKAGLKVSTWTIDYEVNFLGACALDVDYITTNIYRP